MKLTKEQEQRALKQMSPFGKLMWKVKAIKVIDVDVRVCKFEGVKTTKITYVNRLWHPGFIVSFVIATIITVFMQGVPETYNDVKDYLKNNEETIKFYG